jgi:rubrerythrin
VNPCELHTEKDSLSLLIRVEQASESVYYRGLAKLRDVSLARTASQIMAAEAQHEAALNGLLHPGQINRAVPGAFVEGTP